MYLQTMRVFPFVVVWNMDYFNLVKVFHGTIWSVLFHIPEACVDCVNLDQLVLFCTEETIMQLAVPVMLNR